MFSPLGLTATVISSSAKATPRLSPSKTSVTRYAPRVVQPKLGRGEGHLETVDKRFGGDMLTFQHFHCCPDLHRRAPDAPVHDGDGGRGGLAVGRVHVLHEDVDGVLLVDPPALVSHGVLVDGDGAGVDQDLDHVGVDVAHVVGHDERRRQDRPDRHLHPGLVLAQREVADDQLDEGKASMDI